MSARRDWTKILQFDSTFGASAFFFNANEGVIGTGNYRSSIPAQIYYTKDGGATWKLAQFANPDIRGQVTDIYFRDREDGWATIREYAETGWSGIYRSTDGGERWTRVRQAGFPVGIRETSRGVFYTDQGVFYSGQTANDGVMFSSDTGKTWTTVAITETALGIDFMDDSIGFVTRQASLAPHLYTTDGGRTWNQIATSSEAWTPYADPISRSFLLASEVDQLTLSTQTTVVKVPVGSWVESKIRNYGDSGLTGGIAGSHVCRSVIYVQGREPATIAPGGIIRTMDAGATWKFVGGPNNLNDKRFAVTGRGAVVIAFDDTGGVWRTTDGADGTLSPSVLPFVTLAHTGDTARTSLCSSTNIPILLGYSLCDSVRISSVTFLNDSLHELSTQGYNNTGFSPSTRTDTLHIIYQPSAQRKWTVRIQLTIEQPDGYTEDTVISIPLIAGPAPKNPLAFSGTTAFDTINFDSVSICSDAFHTITLSDLGCGNLVVDSIRTSGSPFSLASDVQPFVLSSGNSRTFLLRFAPDAVGSYRGKLYVKNSNTIDSIALLGTGYASGEAVSLSVGGTISASECDSAEFTVTLGNMACKEFAIDSIITSIPFRAGPVSFADSIQPNGEDTLPFTFIPNAFGNDTGTVHLVLSYAGAGRYDTSFSVIGTGTIGKPSFHVSNDSLPMGTVPVCEAGVSDTLVIASSGCADVTVSAAFDTTDGFSLARAPKQTLSASESDTIIVLYQPDNTLGRKTANLIFTTNVGTDTVYVSAVVTSGGGTIAFSVTPNIQAYTCESQPFSISIANSLCDSITIDNVTISDTNASDFSLNDSGPSSFGSGAQTTISGSFTPQDSLTRTASVTFVMHEADGTLHDTTIALTAQGIAVPPIQVNLGVTNVSAGTGQNITIPILAQRGSVTSVSAFNFTLLLNTDLLSPLQTNSNGFFGNIPSTITISRAINGSHLDTAHIHFDRNANVILPAGELCEVVCEAYVASILSTGIELRDVQFHDANGSDQCLASETVPDTNATFVLSQACGDTILSQALGTSTLVLDGVWPNPTTGLVRLTFSVPDNYASDALLEIYNDLGEKLGEQKLVFLAGSNREQTFDLDLKNGITNPSEGILYLRIRTWSGFLMTKVMLSEP